MNFFVFSDTRHMALDDGYEQGKPRTIENNRERTVVEIKRVKWCIVRYTLDLRVNVKIYR